ncbi:MAG: hypothetical protein GXP59_02225, partial [Deltaproteobacteria bacterium]|nr:hypothetical protein [Deltaproteobacteria bacterium]
LLSGDLRVGKPVWQRVQDGIYLLPYINEPVISIGDERLSKFVRQLGMDQSLDVPAGQSPAAEPFTIRPLAQVTLLDLAAAFGRTINGGRTFMPHLLHGVWLGPDKGEIKAHFVPTGRRLLSNSGFINFLRRDFSVGPAKPLVFESLVTVQEKVAADIDFSKADSAGKIKADIREPTDVKRVEATGIGAYTAGSVPLVLVMSLDGIRDGLAVKPVFRRAMTEILRYSYRQKVTSYKQGRGGAVGGRELQGFKRQWRKIHLKTRNLNLTTGRTDAPIFMPKLQGFSLRKSLQSLSGYGLRILISGAGRVVRQMPKAGTSLKSGQNCRLKLRY